jgi:hypothetical protein
VTQGFGASLGKCFLSLEIKMIKLGKDEEGHGKDLKLEKG